MAEKVILILVDGMRPDGLLQCGHPFADRLFKESTACMQAQTVFPSVTLPCHMSLFHSVDPARHGTTTNTYAPQVRPIEGLIERLRTADKKCAFFYTWESLRDLYRPGGLHTAVCVNLHQNAEADRKITQAALDYIRREDPDFMFLYLGDTDECGHNFGWMSKEYLACIHNAVGCVQQVYDALSSGHTLILTADHGGHERMHGTELPEDMTIPLILHGPRFTPGAALESASLKDIPATICALLGAAPAKEWEGKVIGLG